VRGTGDRRTGVYFGEQTVESVMQGMVEFEASDAAGGFDATIISAWAKEFATPVFLRTLRELVLTVAPEAERAMISAETAAAMVTR